MRYPEQTRTPLKNRTNAMNTRPLGIIPSKHNRKIPSRFSETQKPSVSQVSQGISSSSSSHESSLRGPNSRRARCLNCTKVWTSGFLCFRCLSEFKKQAGHILDEHERRVTQEPLRFTSMQSSSSWNALIHRRPANEDTNRFLASILA